MGPLSRMKQFFRQTFPGTPEHEAAGRPWWDQDEPAEPPPSDDTFVGCSTW